MPTLNDPLTATTPNKLPIWETLAQQARTAQKTSLTDYFNTNTDRHHQFSFSASNINANLSRQHIDSSILTNLISLAQEVHLPAAIKAQQQAETINFTEHRPALHTALRCPETNTEEKQLASDCKQKMRRCCEAIQSGEWKGYNGHKITDVVSIGIGGSDLGPRMATEALTPYHNDTIKLHFVTNVDPCDLENTLSPLNPESTVFIIISKSWNTLETLINAKTAKQWFISQSRSQDISQHFIAISSRTDRCQSFGIKPENILPMWDWVGGRFSLWSAAGLPIALATSFEVFESLLTGANEMDKHFFDTPLSNNLPVILALLEVWYVNFWSCSNVAVLPYDHTLRLLPNHFQQLAMESNGKNTDRSGKSISYQTAPVLWGSAGTIGQHSFHQLLHQGTQLIPVDFILPLSSHCKDQAQHAHMIANCLAQAQTLMDGQTPDQVIDNLLAQGYNPEDAHKLAQHKSMPANRPSTIISFKKLTPETLGALIALYEHKTYSASIIWNINAFDQWGVELGKTASIEIYNTLQGDGKKPSNPATQAALNDLLNTTNPNIEKNNLS